MRQSPAERLVLEVFVLEDHELVLLLVVAVLLVIGESGRAMLLALMISFMNSS